MEQWIELEWIWDLKCLENNDIEDDLLCWLKVKDLLSEDDCCMLKLSCLEQSIEHEALPDRWRVFELVIEEHVSLLYDCDDGLIDEDIFSL